MALSRVVSETFNVEKYRDIEITMISVCAFTWISPPNSHQPQCEMWWLYETSKRVGLHFRKNSGRTRPLMKKWWEMPSPRVSRLVYPCLESGQSVSSFCGQPLHLARVEWCAADLYDLYVGSNLAPIVVDRRNRSLVSAVSVCEAHVVHTTSTVRVRVRVDGTADGTKSDQRAPRAAGISASVAQCDAMRNRDLSKFCHVSRRLCVFGPSYDALLPKQADE